MWVLHASRPGDSPFTEEVERQGTAWRRARRLYAAGFSITATQFSVDSPPVPVASFRFDGIRFVRLPKQPPR